MYIRTICGLPFSLGVRKTSQIGQPPVVHQKSIMKNSTLFVLFCFAFTLLLVIESKAISSEDDFFPQVDAMPDFNALKREKRHFAYKCNLQQCEGRCQKLLKAPSGQCAPNGKCYCNRKKIIG